MTDKPTVVEALSAVMGDVQAVGKTGRNTQQGYDFRGVDETVNAVGPAFRKHGVIPLPRVLWHEYGSFTTKTGTVMHTCMLEVEFTFVGPAGDTLVCSTMGESADAGDKSSAKAHSVAYRTALLEALCIPTNAPDPDQESYERVEPMHASQLSALAAHFEAIAEDEEARTQLRKWWAEQPGLPARARWKMLTAEQADHVLAYLAPVGAKT